MLMIVPQFMETEKYEPRKARATISNAMDVGNPSNFVRILEIFHHEFKNLQNVFSSESISDEETRDTMQKVYTKYKYLSIRMVLLVSLLYNATCNNILVQKGIVLETAHPVKFYDVVEPVIGEPVPVPESIKLQLLMEKKSIKIDTDPNSLKEFLLAMR